MVHLFFPDLLRQKQDSLDKQSRVEFILTCHKLEATFDVALLLKHVPDSLRQDWRDFQGMFISNIECHILPHPS